MLAKSILPYMGYSLRMPFQLFDQNTLEYFKTQLSSSHRLRLTVLRNVRGGAHFIKLINPGLFNKGCCLVDKLLRHAMN